MNRTILLIFLLLPRLFLQAAAIDVPPGVSAEAMILVHAKSGRVLLEKNADDRHLIASTTKLMTALAAVKEGDLDEVIEIRPEWTRVEGSSMYLKTGETYLLRELLTGLLLASGNDAALAIAESLDGSVNAFAGRMNAIASGFGMDHTHFSNPHGLDAEDHFSTARDLAILMGHVMEEPVLREILAMGSCRIHGREYRNHNKLLASCPGTLGGKTGYTMAAGRCLVSCCERAGMELICVTLSDKDDWADHSSLYDWAFGCFRAYFPSEADFPHVPLISGDLSSAAVTVRQPGELCAGVHESAKTTFFLPDFTFAPVRHGEQAGIMTIRIGSSLEYSFPLYWKEDISILSQL